ncbi:MAG: leucine-rich repeat domain-containing protein [Gammaproteobacteria bacterium]|nr:leucine-rich repeat domain-containing protein [Gammaproteobacteria bacterium]
MKKIKNLLLIITSLIFVLFLSACGENTTEFSFDNASFDISLSSDNSLTAQTKKVGNEYSLTISGSGASKNFEASSKVPWNVLSKKISSVSINEGITVIGSNLFTSLSLDYYFIPNTVTKIEDNAFKENTHIYSYSTSVECSESTKIYYYSESKPLEVGKYFHIVENTPVIWDSYKVLFIGNSFTYFPTGESNPGVVNAFNGAAIDLGEDITTEFVVKGSHTLTQFSNASDEMGSIVDAKLRSSNDYDFVILQEHSTTPIDKYDTFLNAVSVLKDKISSTQKDCKIYLYETWGFPSKVSGTGSYASVEVMELALRNAYTNCAKELYLNVVYVGKAFTEVFKNYTNISLYGTDNKHQSFEGAYLSGLTILSTLVKADVRNTNYVGDIDSSIAVTLRKIAYETTFNTGYALNEGDSGSTGNETIEDPLTQDNIVIAWYAKTTKSNLNQDLIDSINLSLKEYLKTQGVSDDVISKIAFKGYDGNVGPSTQALLNDGYVSLMLGWGTIENITTTGNIDIASIVKSVEDLAIKEANRSLVMLKESDITNKIFEYLTSEDGRKLFQ